MPATGWPGTKRRRSGRCGDHVVDDLALHRAHVGDDGPGREPGPHGFGGGAAGTRRHAQHDDLGTFDRASGVGVGVIADPPFDAPAHGFSRARAADDLADRPVLAQGQGQRAVDQPGADQGQALEWGSCGAPAAHEVAQCPTSRRFSSSLPTVMRRQSGSP